MLTTGGTPKAPQKLVRIFKQNRGLVARIRSALRRIRRTTLVIPRSETIGLKLDHDRIDSVIEKIVRGLFYFEYGETLDPQTIVRCRALDTDNVLRAFNPYLSHMRPGKRLWPNVFEYIRNRSKDVPQGSMWFLRFYGKTNYVAITNPD